MNLENLSEKNLAAYIDHTLLKPETTKLQVRKLCEEAFEHYFYAVCINFGLDVTCIDLLV